VRSRARTQPPAASSPRIGSGLDPASASEDSFIPLAGAVGLLLASLLVILLGSELFTNGIEWVGKKLNLSEGAVGSLLAAVGTALPETMIPVTAILFSGSSASHDVGVGAIAGAPFMLGTLAFCVTGVSVFAWAKSGRRAAVMQADGKVIGRDMAYFLIGYTAAVLTTFVRQYTIVRWAVAAGLLLLYAFYVRQTLAAGEVGDESPRPLHLKSFLKHAEERTPARMVAVQVVLALGLILLGSKLFVDQVMHVAQHVHAAPIILSLLIAPIATELPEKMNSVLWTREGKDTLALGNITGAMVFQSCFPVALGVVATPWALERETLLSAVLALSSTALLYLILRLTGRIQPAVLLLGGIFYAFFIAIVIISRL